MLGHWENSSYDSPACTLHQKYCTCALTCPSFFFFREEHHHDSRQVTINNTAVLQSKIKLSYAILYCLFTEINY